MILIGIILLIKLSHTLFEEQVVKSPNNVGVVYEGVKLTYKELNDRANQLAHYLIKHNIKPDDLVALLLDRSEHMIIAILGVLKAGAAYVPMDPEYPDDRIKYILNDTKANLVIANNIYTKRINTINNKVMTIPVDSKAFTQNLTKYDNTNPVVDNLTSNNLAYVIYTSGTTGKPKGVMIEHLSLMNSVKDGIYNRKINIASNILFSSSYAFDSSILEIFPAIVCGAKIFVLKNIIRNNLYELLEYSQTNKITHIFVTTRMAESFSELILNKVISLKILIVAGEKLSKIHKSSVAIVNEYGPTEVTITSTIKHVKNENDISIGKPISNSKAYVLSSDLSSLPIGAIGELYIGGVGLARGYLNQPGLTKERFITNPFATRQENQQNKNSRLYKTGDLVRWLPSGELEYIGRNDFQVKIRGFRIELGEIESVLNEHTGVKQAVVLAKQNKKTNNKYLVAYYTSDTGSKLNEDSILSYLATRLPDYMIPTVMVHMDKLPLTANGKLDRKALPDLALGSSTSTYVAPRNELEIKLRDIFASVLGLKTDKVGINDDFFKLGGNSIMAIKLVNNINNNTPLTFSIADIFKYKNIKNLTQNIENESKDITTIPLANVKQNKQVLSFAQERLFFIHKYEGGTNAYNIPFIYKLNNKTNIKHLSDAIHSTLKRQDILRSTIKEDQNNIYQVINTFSDKYFNEVRVKDSQELYRRITDDINYIFNLSNEFPIKVSIYSLEDTEKYISIVIHHIAFDGWSADIFLHELYEFYNHYRDNTSLTLPKLGIQYKDFAIWQRKYLTGKVLDKQLRYWKKSLDGYENINLPTDHPRPLQVDYIGNNINFTLNKELSLNLRDTAKELGVSLYTLLLASYYLILKAYSNQDDIVIGTPIANRHYPQIQNLIGFFVNSLPLRINIKDKQNLVQFIKLLGDQIIDAQLHQDLPFEKLVDELRVEKDTSRHPIFQIVFGVQSFADNKQHYKDNILLPYDGQETKYDVAKFDIETFIDDRDEVLRGSFNYRVSLYKESTIKRFINTYINILEQVSKVSNNKELTLSDLSYLSQKETDTILHKWNDTDRDYPSNKTIHTLFEEQVVKSPNNVGVVYEGVKLTYKELNERANQLAHYLIKHNIKPDDLVALLLDRSENMIIAILGVLKAGAAYVPMDPEYPDDRIKYILNDTKANLVIANNTYTKRINTINNKVMTIPIDSKAFIKDLTKYPDTNPVVNKLTSNNLAYIIYTSGTTGRPKGVLQIHANVMRLFTSTQHLFNFNSKDIWSLSHSYIFDFTIWEIWGALIHGAKLIVPNNNTVRDLNLFYDLCKKEKVTILNQTPSVFYQFSEIARNNNHTKQLKLRYIIFGGEALNYSKLIPWFDVYKYDNPKLVNMYGITETTVHVTYNKISKNTISQSRNKIGKVIPDLKAYVLSEFLSPLPIGAIGELYIGGVGLARGYLNQPSLTKEKFIPNPFATRQEKQENKNSRLYKTGDLVRWLPSGELEYIGRNDFQVKIRGFRIELGEIESVLNEHTGVKQAVVLAKQNKETNNKYLVAYYTSDTGSKLNEDSILSYLATRLPDYMIPTVMVHMDKLPLTANGKLDRKALPDLALGSSTSTYIAPRNELEIKLRDIFASVLGLKTDKVGINDDFFKLGGNSIMAIKLVNNINNNTPLTFSIADIFKYKNIKNLTQNIENESKDITTIPLANVKQNKQVLSFAQERLFFIHKYEGGTNAYNIPFIYKLNNKTNIKHLSDAIHSTLKRQDILRSTIKEDQNNIYQVINTFSDKYFNEVRVKDSQELYRRITDDINYIFNLSNEFPIKVSIYSLEDTEKYISIVIHHIAFDGWSADIFLHELYEFYNHYRDNTSLTLPKLGIQYKDFAIWQRKYLTGKVLDKQLRYWKKSLDGYENINLPTDHPRPLQVDYIGNNINFTLNKELSLNLRDTAKELGVSLYTLLLASYYLILKAYSNQDDIVIGTPIANRHYPQIQNLIGFFVNSLPLRINIKDKQNLVQFIKLLGDQIIDAQLHQDLPFEKLVDELRVEKDTSRHPIFQIVFGVQSFADNKQHYKDNILLPYDGQETKYDVAKFDIETFIDDRDEVLRGSFNYRVSLYKESTIKRFINTYINILEQVSKVSNNKELTLSDLSYLSQKETDTILHKWNDTDRDYPSNKTIHTLFEEQVVKSPNNVGVVYEGVKLTYKELNERANQLAHYLIKHNITPDDLVTLLLDRSENMIIAILGVLKAGAAYVPMDPEYPDDRIKYILEDTNTNLVIANNTYTKRINTINNKVTTISIDAESFTQNLTKYDNTNPVVDNLTSNNLAYVIYTSGTTGNPKGVMIEHKGVVNLNCALSKRYNLEKNEVILQLSNYIFDASVEQIILALLSGNTLVCIPQYNLLHSKNFYNYLDKYNVSQIDGTPPLLKQYNIKKIKSIRRIVYGGERVDKLLHFNNNYKIINTYGPTEASITSTIKFIKNNQDISIGKPISNTKVYVLSECLSPLPIGAIGELYIGGAGLARGYLNQPGLTKERFITNPFATRQENQQNKNSRLYKTGDLVRWLPSGELEYIGRNDFQVKIRGFRIELGEIESVLNEHTGVKQAVVLAKQNKKTNNKYLVAYYTSDTGSKLNEDSILSYLATRLPDYMIPTVMVHMDKLPLTANGKLDRKALPDLELGSSTSTYIAPRNELEIKLRDIFASVLGLKTDKVGINDDFFKLGGNSIMAIKLVNNINNNTPLTFSIADIFKYKNIKNLTQNIENESKDITTIPLANVKQNKQVLSFAQERLFFIHKYEGGTNAYNIPFIYKLNNKTNIKHLSDAIHSTLKRQDILRSTIKEDQNNIYQVINTFSDKYFNEVRVKDSQELYRRITDDINYIFNLSNEFPIKVSIYSLEDTEKYISIVIHHIAFDGWSADIFLHELYEFYNHYRDNTSLTLPKLGIQYKDFAIWQRKYLTGKVLDKQLRYWKKSLDGYENINLPTDHPRPLQVDYIGNNINFTLNKELSLNLRDTAKELGVSLYTLLLASYYLILKAYSNQDDIVIGTPIANRHYPQIQNLIGFFVNSLPLRINIKDKQNLVQFIKLLGDQIIDAQLHQDLPFEKLVDELRVEKDTSRHPIFQIVFGVQSFADNKQHYKDNILLPYDGQETKYDVAKFDIESFIDDSDEVLRGSFNYRVSLYKESTNKEIYKYLYKYIRASI